MSFTNMPSCMEVLRGRRTTLLLESDWTVMPDSPLTDAKKAEWSTYRLTLLDLPTNSNWPNLQEGDWPAEPS